MSDATEPLEPTVPAAKPRISAFIITKNEAAKIADCLASLAWCDEIVVVDDFSSDATPKICREQAVSLHQHSFTGFKDQKSYAMSLAAHDWVLELDADERVTPEMRDAILALGAADLERYDCFEFKRKTRFWGKWIRHASLYPDYKGRLYCRTRGAWSAGNIHERFVVRGATKKLAGEILHPQDLDLYSYILRTARYADLSAADYFSRGRRASWHHVTLRPIATFCTRYLIRLGILDGVHGFVISVMGALGTFLKYMKLYEIQKKAAGGLGG
jgi:glycosyltransferase involved in cell wall biosynthesis